MMNSFGVFFFIGIIVTTAAVFKEYCTPGLCKYNGGDGQHTGCRDNILHNGQLQGTCPKDAYLIDIDKFHRKLILDYHNEHREIVASGGLIPNGISSACRIGKVKWDEELKLTAELHAKNCIFAHDRCRNTLNYPLSGQNLGVNTYMDKVKLNVTEKILKFLNGWYLEYKDVKQSIIDKFAADHDKKAPMTGHFLTMINERCNRMGCSGVHYRHSATKLNMMLSCTYSSTSIEGGTIYNSCKTPGVKCTTGRDLKYRNLCSVKEVYNYDDRLQLIPYDSTSVRVNEDYVDDEEDEEEEEDENGMIVTTPAVFTEYCTPGLCKYSGGDGMHIGCPNKKLHNAKLQANCSEDAYIIDIDKYHQNLIIDFHNEHRNTVAGGGLVPDGIRSACRMGIVKWDKELKRTAKLHAKSCTFAHDKCRNTLNYPFSGQNLGVATYLEVDKLNITEKILKFMNKWYEEYKDVKQSVIDSFVPSTLPMTGHFLTMINERSNRMGCSAVNYRKNKTHLELMLTCNYASTSINNGAIFNSCKTPGLKCTSGRDLKYRNLCSVNEVYNYDDRLVLIPYDANDGRHDVKDEKKDVSTRNNICHFCLLISFTIMYILG